MSEPFNDFGFTAVDESELNVYKEATAAQAKVEEKTQAVTATQEKLMLFIMLFSHC